AQRDERRVEIEYAARRDERFRDPPQMPLHGMGLRISAADEYPEQHPSDVGVEDGGPFAEREASNRARRVRANSLERKQRRLVRRQAPVVPGDGFPGDR